MMMSAAVLQQTTGQIADPGICCSAANAANKLLLSVVLIQALPETSSAITVLLLQSEI